MTLQSKSTFFGGHPVMNAVWKEQGKVAQNYYEKLHDFSQDFHKKNDIQCNFVKRKKSIKSQIISCLSRLCYNFLEVLTTRSWDLFYQSVHNSICESKSVVIECTCFYISCFQTT